jgi:hypothetical protein
MDIAMVIARTTSEARTIVLILSSPDELGRRKFTPLLVKWHAVCQMGWRPKSLKSKDSEAQTQELRLFLRVKKHVMRVRSLTPGIPEEEGNQDRTGKLLKTKTRLNRES